MSMKISQQALDKIIQKHRMWLRNEPGGECADFRCLDLRGFDLKGEDLCKANFSDADLRGVDLRNADLCGAKLCAAQLCGADLTYADLSGANLEWADLRCSTIAYANLSGANLNDAMLQGALVNENTIMDRRDMDIFYPMCCPDTGSFIGWKKTNEDYIIKLQIPENAYRSSAYGRKCRCSEAIVLAIENLDGTSTPEGTVARSMFDASFRYEVGKIVKPDCFDPDRRNECSNGIHFFITRQEAVDY